MNSTDISNSIIIILIFATITIVSILGIGISNIKKNWNEYKCQPIVMPFAGVFGKDPTKNFDECMKGVQKEFVSDLLGPINAVFAKLNIMGEEMGKFMSIASGLGNEFQNSFMGGAGDIFTVISQLGIGVSMMSIKIQDMMRKIMAVFISVIYVILGLNITAVSIWNGLPGQVVREATKIASAI